MEDVINKIAERVNNEVKALRGKECDRCKKNYSAYDGKCTEYYWNLDYFSGFWNFSLYRHKNEIWHKTINGNIVDILLSALKGIAKKEWENHPEEG